ncbi:hypothetical protein LXL04_001029 [Taraxacum kok-saghyz]
MKKTRAQDHFRSPAHEPKPKIRILGTDLGNHRTHPDRDQEPRTRLGSDQDPRARQLLDEMPARPPPGQMRVAIQFARTVPRTRPAHLGHSRCTPSVRSYVSSATIHFARTKQPATNVARTNSDAHQLFVEMPHRPFPDKPSRDQTFLGHHSATMNSARQRTTFLGQRLGNRTRRRTVPDEHYVGICTLLLPPMEPIVNLMPNVRNVVSQLEYQVWYCLSHGKLSRYTSDSRAVCFTSDRVQLEEIIEFGPVHMFATSKYCLGPGLIVPTESII